MKLNKVSITLIIACMIIIVILIIFLRQLKQFALGMLTNNYFTIDELCASDTARKRGIDNTPTPDAQANLVLLRDRVLNPAREALGSTIYVNSGYRCPQLNAAVGGTATSQHQTGQAADITTKSRKRNQQLFAILVQQGNFDQLIWEGDGKWIHVSYSTTANRGAILAQNTNGGYTNIQSNWQTTIA